MDRKIETFEELVKLIDSNFMRERGVAFYADQLCLTPKYLSVIRKPHPSAPSSRSIPDYRQRITAWGWSSLICKCFILFCMRN